MPKFTKEDALEKAKKIFIERYEGAHFCIASGSIVMGLGADYSDLDLVVVYPELKNAFRESFIFEDMPVEAFVHDYETIQAFIDSDYKEACVAITHMIASGTTFPKEDEISLKLKKYALNLLKAGSEPFEKVKLLSLRYEISDLIDDLRGDRPIEEEKTILYSLYPRVGALALRQKGKFVSSGKRLARDLKEHCLDIFNDLEKIMIQVHKEKLKPEHIKQLDNIINALGGLLFDGYKQDAPADKRSKAIWLND